MPPPARAAAANAAGDAGEDGKPAAAFILERMSPMKPNTLYYGDCLEVMKDWPDACADLIYLDPPFNSNANYNILFGNKKANNGGKHDLAQAVAFTDTWEWNEETGRRIKQIKRTLNHRARGAVIALDSFYQSGTGMLAYLVYMADRINAMYPLLKDSGSLYLHCDPTASHYLKMILDDVFGVQNFRNEIVWAYRTGGASKKRFARKHDVILFYGKTPAHVFNPQSEKSYTKSASRKAGTVNYGGGEAEFYEDSSGVYNIVNMRDVWDIPYIGSTDKERLGYPTQKPLALLERIIEASSNPGDVVLDPFCGCGTTIHAAINLKRKFAGIDISMYALDVIQKKRLKNMRFAIDGVPAEMSAAEDMARKRPFAFEKWVIHCIPGFVSNNKQRSDGGVDGWAMLLNAPDGESGMCIAQVKGGKPSVDAIRAFAGKLSAGYASVGVFITLRKWDTPTVRKCVESAGKLKQGASEFNRLVMWSVEEHFAGARPPLPTLADPQTGLEMQFDWMVQEPLSMGYRDAAAHES